MIRINESHECPAYADVRSPCDLKRIQREVNSLLRAMGEFNLEKGLVITEDFDGKETTGGKTIVFLPLWRWLLL